MPVQLTPMENNVFHYLLKNKEEVVYWEQLVQFAKDPQNVKPKTIKNVVAEIRRKHRLAGEPDPIKVKFAFLTDKNSSGTEKIPEVTTKVETNNMVKVVRSLESGKMVDASTVAQLSPVEKDFIIERNYKRIRTKSGVANLAWQEWEIFCHLHKNHDRIVSMEELKKMLYPSESKCPASWGESIARSFTRLRRSIPELKNGRLVTVLGKGYMLS